MAHFQWDDLSPEIKARLAASNPELRAELHREKRDEQLKIARLNRRERERIKFEEEQQKELEKEFAVKDRYIQGIIDESNRRFQEIIASSYIPMVYYESPSIWVRIARWLKR